MDQGTDRLRLLASELREARQDMSNAEERLASLNKRIREIEFGELTDLMHALGVNSFSLNKEGNNPALDFELGTYISANIAKDWDEERREEAFAALPDELIKITVKVTFSKGEGDLARSLVDDLVTTGYTVSVERGVHSATLKSWLKEQFENGGDIPNLETIGAHIAPRVKVKEIKA
jgi:hypothetical protein